MDGGPGSTLGVIPLEPSTLLFEICSLKGIWELTISLGWLANEMEGLGLGLLSLPPHWDYKRLCRAWLCRRVVEFELGSSLLHDKYFSN